MFNRGSCSEFAFVHARSLSLFVLVRVRDAHELRLTRTYTRAQLKAPAESKDVWICGTCASADGASLVCADWSNASVKGVELATGSLSTLYKEAEQDWRVSNVRIAAQPDGTHSLIVVELKKSDETSKRMLVADRVASGIFSRTYAVKWKDDTNV